MDGLRGEHRQLLTSKPNLCLTRLFLPSNLNIDGFCWFSRRIEDKLKSKQMAAKMVQIMFDTSSLQGNRMLFHLISFLFLCGID